MAIGIKETVCGDKHNIHIRRYIYVYTYIDMHTYTCTL